MRRKRPGLALAAVAASLLAVLPAAASADFHEISIREVYPGSIANPNAEYVELQMWRSGQEFVSGHVLHLYGPTGTKADTLFPTDVPSGVNQATILIASPEATTQFAVETDFAFPSANQLDPSGGAVCWESLDCVSWGSFSGGPLPSPAGTPAAAIPDEMALRRTIAPGCATLLEGGDDRDNSTLDFSAVFPSPRPNSVAPSEHACTSGGGGGGQGGDGDGAPQTSFKRKPPRRTHDRTPTFRFAADEGGVTFQCKLDRRRFRPCRSPFTTGRLSLGRHTFAVRARDANGTLDPTPASYSFKVLGR